MDFQPGAFIAHYEIIRSLGEGGMGRVYLARDTRLGRLVAIKVLTFGSDGLVNAQFLSEARATARCRHENIVIIYEADEIDSMPYMVLEYVEGRTLRAFMGENGIVTDATPFKSDISDLAPRKLARIAPAMCIELMLPVARALASAHALGIVHRDLKPENILVAADGSVKVVDFGIAAWLDEEERRRAGADELGEATGTLPYMAPESLLNDAPDHRVDIWAFGIILFELALGHHPLAPFTMHRLPEVMDTDTPMPSARSLAPELGPLSALMSRCLDKRKGSRLGTAAELVTELAAWRANLTVSQLHDSGNPFAGLMAFQEADSGKFFGRDRDIAGLISRLRLQPLMAVGGPSGAGKSSFVRAGIIPAFKRLGNQREATILRPGKRPLLSMASALIELAQDTLDDLRASSFNVTAGPEALASSLRARPGLLGAILRASCRARGAQAGTMLFVDQFEEIFTLCADPTERAAFLSCIEGAADDATSPLRVILAMRSDFLDRLADARKLSSDVAKGLFLLPPLGKDGLLEALTKPVEMLGYRYETPELVEKMLSALERTNAPLPLLQFMAAKLWEARDTDRKLLTSASYDKLGGVEGTLASHADTVVSSMSARDKELARQFFERLVTPERTRAIASESDLRELAKDAAEADRVLARLVEARLLMAEKDESNGGVSVEIVHESLIARWPMLSRWLDENKDEADFLARLRIAARQWRESGKPRGLLWREETLVEARRFRARSRTELSKTEQEFLDAVFSLGELVARRKRLLVLTIVGVSFILAAAMGTLAWKERQANQEATEQAARTREFAEKTRLEASHARDAARVASARDNEGDPTFALSLLREIEEPQDSPAFPFFLSRVSRKIIAETVLPDHGGQVWTAELSADGQHALTAAGNDVYVWDLRHPSKPRVLRGHTGAVWRATYSPDGRQILSASWDQTARIWPVDGGDPIVLKHKARVSWAAWSPDGRRVVTAGWDPAAYVFSADGQGPPKILQGHTERLRRASFSPDGTRVTTASFDGTARIFTLDDSAPPIVLSGHEKAVVDAVFSPDGRRIATISADTKARIFPVEGSDKPLVFKGHERKINSVAWSPDGKRIVTASEDSSARVWDADDPNRKPIPLGHARDVRMATFSPNAKFVLTTSTDNTAHIWKVGALGTVTEFTGHHLGVEFASFSADGSRFITASGDGSARIWLTEPNSAERLFRWSSSTFPDVDLTSDNQRMLITWPGSKDLQLWRVDGIDEPLTFTTNEEIVQSSVSHDDTLVVSAHLQGTVHLWGIGEAKSIKEWPGHGASARFATFSPDDSRVAVAYDDGALRLFPTKGSDDPIVLQKKGNRITELEYTADGNHLVTLSQDEPFLRIWTLSLGTNVVLQGHSSDVEAFILPSDGKRVLTVSADNTARITKIDGTGEPVVLRGHTHKVVDGDFSPDGQRVVTASADGTIRLWNANGTGEATILRLSQDPPRHIRWSPDGKRIVAGSERTIYVWLANGTSVPIVLDGASNRIHQLHWAPDSSFLVASIADGSIHIWHHLEPAATLNDLVNQSWQTSRFCLTIAQRQDILGLTEEGAKQGFELCSKRAFGDDNRAIAKQR